jgi:hypothetical protein
MGFVSNDELCLNEAEMTECVSRTERSSDVSVASVTTASSRHPAPSTDQRHLTYEQDHKMQARTLRLGVGKEARGQPIYSPAGRSRDEALVQRGCYGVFRASLALFTGLPGQEMHRE